MTVQPTAQAGRVEKGRAHKCQQGLESEAPDIQTAASQFPMSSWSLRFLDSNAEAAHSEARSKSPTLIYVLSILNAILLGVYWTGTATGCTEMRENFSPLLTLHLSYEFVELYFYLRPPRAEQTCLWDFIESLKVLWIGGGFAFITLWGYLFRSYNEDVFIYTPDAQFCTYIGLVINGHVALVFLLIPYVAHSSFTLKMCMSVSVMIIHGLSPFWLPLEIELPAIASGVAVGNALGYVLEHSLRSTFREQYARQADQELLMQMKIAANMRLTHTIKGKCGTANSLAFAVISCLRGICIEQVERAVQLVHRMRFLLEEAEWWCNHRQLCVHLELGTYQTKRAVCNVKARIEQLVGCDGDVDNCALTSCAVDTTVLGLAVEEALSNARQFRSRGTKIAISVQVEEVEGGSMLHVQMDSTNRADVPLLSTEQCSQVLQSGYKKHDLSAFSDGVGLTNVQQAAHAIGGRIWLQGYSVAGAGFTAAESRKNHTVFHLLIPVERIVWRDFEDVPNTEDEAREVPEVRVEFSAVLREEQEGARLGRDDASTDQAQARSPIAAGETGVSQALAPSLLAPVARRVDDPLICLGLDDSSLCRQLHELMFADFLNADMSRSASLGSTVEEVESFVDVALGLKTLDCTHVPEDEQQAVDVVLIDQHLIVDDKRWLGSDIAQALRVRGFGGVICLMSGTVSEHLHELQEQEVIDMAFSKGESPLDIAETIVKLHEQNAGAHRAGPS